VSAIIDEQGKVKATAPQYEEAVISGIAQPMQGATLYVRWGNWFLIPILLVLVSVIWWLGRGKFR